MNHRKKADPSAWIKSNGIPIMKADSIISQFILLCHIITDETRVNIPDMLSELGEHIEVKNMDCVWDFIYEVDK